MDVPYSIVVEDHEYEQYARYINEDKILILPEKYLKNYDACTTTRAKVMDLEQQEISAGKTL